MTHPFSFTMSAIRESWCYFYGHKWKYRKLAGLPFRCIRCRLRSSERFDPWYKELWWAAKTFWRSLGVFHELHSPWPERIKGEGYSYSSFPVYLVALTAGVSFGLEQAWGSLSHSWRLPIWPCSVFGRFYWIVARWLENRTTHMRWMPPDSGDPHEIGLWQNANQVTDGAERTRIYFIQPTNDPSLTPQTGTANTYIDWSFVQ